MLFEQNFYHLLARWWAIATIIAMPLYLLRFNIGGVPTNLLEILAIGAITLSIITVGSVRLWWQSALGGLPKSLLVAGTLLCGGAALSTLSHDAWRTGFGIMKSWFILPLLFTISLRHLSKIGVLSHMHIFRALITSGALVALISILSAFLGIESAITYDHRLRAFYASPNYLALILAPLTPLALTSILLALRNAYSIHTRFFATSAFILICATLFLTQSLGGMLAAATGIIFLAITATRQRRTIALTACALAVAGVLILALLWNTPRIQDFFVIPDRSSLASRMMIWHAAWDIALDHPILGIGPGRFQEVYLTYQRYYPPYLEWAVPQPHNILLAFWLQTGVIGLCGFLLLIFMLFQRWHRTCHDTLMHKKSAFLRCGAYAALFTILLHGIIDTPYWKNDLALLFWILAIFPFLPTKNAHMKR